MWNMCTEGTVIIQNFKPTLIFSIWSNATRFFVGQTQYLQHSRWLLFVESNVQVWRGPEDLLGRRWDLGPLPGLCFQCTGVAYLMEHQVLRSGRLSRFNILHEHSKHVCQRIHSHVPSKWRKEVVQMEHFLNVSLTIGYRNAEKSLYRIPIVNFRTQKYPNVANLNRNPQ